MRSLADESGYTLVETLVALGIFVSVVLPLVVTLGELLTDRYPDVQHNNLLTCEREISAFAGQNVSNDTVQYVSGDCILTRSVQTGTDLSKELVVITRKLGDASVDTLICMCKYRLEK